MWGRVPGTNELDPPSMSPMEAAENNEYQRILQREYKLLQRLAVSLTTVSFAVKGRRHLGPSNLCAISRV